MKKTKKQPDNGVNNVIVLNPPEKLPPKNVNEIVSKFFQKRNENLAERATLVLQAKAEKLGIDEEILKTVYQRGLDSYTARPQLTKEQYAMNRVNSFVAGGIGLLEDVDLIPIEEAPIRGGAAKPHIVPSGKFFHIYDNRGNIVHTVDTEEEARRHLAQNFTKYFKKEEYVSESKRGSFKARRPGTGGASRPRVIKKVDPYNPKKKVYIVVGKKHDEKLGRKDIKFTTQSSTDAYNHLRNNYYKYLNENVSKKDPRSRFEGTKSLVDIYKRDTPGENVKEEKMKGDDPCWKGYEMVGHKKKGGREVPNCVPKSEGK